MKKLGKRVKYGVKEELLLLVELKGIGRARARKLFNAGIKKPSDLIKNQKEVEKILGKTTSDKLFKQMNFFSIQNQNSELDEENKSRYNS